MRLHQIATCLALGVILSSGEAQTVSSGETSTSAAPRPARQVASFSSISGEPGSALSQPPANGTDSGSDQETGAAKPSPPFSMQISAAKSTIRAGSPVYIKVSMTNTSTQDVDCSTFYVNGSDLRFRVTVHNQDGKSMKRQDVHPERLPGSFQMCSLPSGESTITKEMLVMAFHDLSQPGTYQLYCERGISNTEKDGAVSSNEISISIEP